MPQLIVAPGLGDSLDRYLERLGRRGEEQRRLQQQRDFVQAEMDQRASELRTRIISGAISEGVGLFTDEMQRNRAFERGETQRERSSQRRIVEQEESAYLEGKPDILRTKSALGIVTHNSAYDLIMKATRLDVQQVHALARLREHPNEYASGQGAKAVSAERDLAEYAEWYQKGKMSKSKFVEATTNAIQTLLDITPSGNKKLTWLSNVHTNDGSDPNNPLPIGQPFFFDPEGKKKPEPLVHPLLEIMAGRIADEWYDNLEDPKYTAYKLLTETEKGKEEWKKSGKAIPDQYLPVEVGDGVGMLDVNRFNKLNAALWNNADDADVARTLRGVSPLEGQKSPEQVSKEEESQTLDIIKKGGPTPFGNMNQAALNRLLKQGVDLTWPNLITHNGKTYRARYVGTDEVEFTLVSKVPRRHITGYLPAGAQ